MTETVARLREELLLLSAEEKKMMLLEVFPELGREALHDPTFLPALLPVLLGLIKQSGFDLSQLLQLANVLAATAPTAERG